MEADYVHVFFLYRRSKGDQRTIHLFYTQPEGGRVDMEYDSPENLYEVLKNVRIAYGDKKRIVYGAVPPELKQNKKLKPAEQNIAQRVEALLN